MKRARSLTIVLVGLLAAGNAVAASPAPKVELSPSRGFVLGAPSLETGAQGLNVRGAVCRSSQGAMRPVAVRVEHVDAQGATLDTRTASIAGALSARGRGCAFYSTQVAWREGSEGTLRITSLTAAEIRH
jgi:hypothetical protein